ncbi:23S rRNA (adenine(2030)-N(6))-methyltransferase RlmJ [Allopusillimonas ginsengisoli]|uniref:23S rRNA (adenine(2030)-N(6))-methyltransferase RlmJ n=1 Tax=Allopusillimonas ginsengisoli TaxID=453575 RepID=UPI001021719E|nr:23S rRNA (adenine(2030)-N(6))-methyltransferase RlmJ [Allopusillimonas ginsengisoli]TEA77687.1 23S rRNA (adenine(2030)-N(6))-methyltransferase RlmJ [Allopusillimonas ginsengisoli]
MFSYRHAFHAGNHADVLKHAVLVHILDYFNRKDNPYWVIDTHAGAGIYDLRSDWALKNGEFTEGLDRLLGVDNLPAILQRYLEEVAHFNPDGIANFYPGSPWLALNLLREHDRLRLFEMHPSEADALRHNLQTLGGTALRLATVYEADGFNGLKGQLPPAPRRGITIIDPSYEDKLDYRKTLQALNEGLKRFATGCFAIWHPLVQRREANEMARTLERLKVSWVHATLTVRKPAADGYGLHGSGMFVVNPPWTLYQALESAMPWLAEHLKQDDRSAFTLKQYGN